MNDKMRTIFLVSTAIATFSVLGRSILFSEALTAKVKSYTFPSTIALPGWQLSFQQPVNPNLVKPPAYISGDFIAGTHYQYLQERKYLDIEMRYIANTNGDLKSFITSQTGELSSVLKQDLKRGFYSLYIHQDKAYLSACINPHGISTVTSDRFNRNLMIHNTHPKQIVPWLLGKSEFRNKRCLWAHLSTPVNDNFSADDAYATLEAGWHDWHDWWRANYPQS
ncbi:MAG: cyanoexosortase A system-associated protein [Cyanobacteria bacterium P01_G01_bin.19]